MLRINYYVYKFRQQHLSLFAIGPGVDCTACVAGHASAWFSGSESSWSGGAVGGGFGNGKR